MKTLILKLKKFVKNFSFFEIKKDCEYSYYLFGEDIYDKHKVKWMSFHLLGIRLFRIFYSGRITEIDDISKKKKQKVGFVDD